MDDDDDNDDGDGDHGSNDGVGSESGLDVTEAGFPMPPAARAAPAEDWKDAEGISPGSPSPGGANFADSATTGDGSGSSSSSDDSSTSSGDLPVLTGRAARDLRWMDNAPELLDTRTRTQRHDALLAGIERRQAKYERLLPKQRLQEEIEGVDRWLEESGELPEQREEEQGSACPLAMAASQNPELSIPSPIGQKPSDVEPPPRTVAGVERSVYRACWEEAMRSEFDGHTKTGTFTMVDRVPEGRKPVSSKWCFDYKTDKEGKITKCKARLVARGFTQIRDVDYTHSSSPCPSSASIKLVLAVANERQLPIYHWDVAQAFIRATLDDEVYLKLPDGCGEKSKKSAKVERAIYGLKQSGRKWGYLCADTLIEDGFEQSKADPCIFRKIVDGSVVMIIGVYVDDLLVGGSTEDCDKLLAFLNRKFKTNNLGECTWYDGCGIERDEELGTIKLSQEAYVDSLITRFNVQTTSLTPASPGDDLGPKRDDEPGGDWPVREAVGSLLWLSTMTRPDITNAVRAVARYAHTPTERLWKSIMRILSYLKGTPSLGITYVRGSGLGLDVYADADYAEKANNRRSVSGVAVTLGGTVVSHASRTQKVTSLSTSEAEYIAAGDGVKEALFVKAVLSFIAPETYGASIKVLEDNMGAKALIENPLSSARTKHIDVRFHFIRELFRRGKISVEYVKSADQHADILTKALPRANFQYHRRCLMNLSE